MSTAVGQSRSRLFGLGGRLLAGQLLVVIIGAGTAWLVASAVGPVEFHKHLQRAGMMGNRDAAAHAEEAFSAASRLSLSIAMAAAALAGLVVTLYGTRRISRSVGSVSMAAVDIAGGHYQARVEAPGLGREFDELAAAFNSMAARLEAVESTRRRLLSDLAHEMRTPVAVVDAYLEGIEDGVTTLEADNLAVLRAQTQRLTRLAEDVAAVSRTEEGQLQLRALRCLPADLVHVATAAAAVSYAEKGVTLRVDLDPDLPAVLADRDRVGQVFANLLDNALRHTATGGAVTVTGRAGPREISITVADTGEGIDAEHLPHLFERFYRADAARDRGHGGSGIGLAIVKAVVEAHGGSVTARSDGAGLGAEFRVTLPRA